MMLSRLFVTRAALGSWSRVGAAAAVCLLGAVGCTTPVEVADPEATTPSPGDPAPEGPAATIDVFFGDINAPDGGTVKQLRLPGPQSAALVTCDQDGFLPFAYGDMGLDWVGCQVPMPGDAVGAESALTEPQLSDVPSPVGGTVSQITIPGPQSAISVLCEIGSPFVYEDQGTWVGCQGS